MQAHGKAIDSNYGVRPLFDISVSAKNKKACPEYVAALTESDRSGRVPDIGLALHQHRHHYLLAIRSSCRVHQAAANRGNEVCVRGVVRNRYRNRIRSTGAELRVASVTRGYTVCSPWNRGERGSHNACIIERRNSDS